MKRILRIYLIEFATLWLVNNYVEGLVFDNGIKTFLITSLALAVGSVIVKPVVNLLLLPLNLVTFGLFKWFSSAVILYLITLVIKDFHIVSFTYSGISSKWFDIPSINLHSWLAIIAFSFIISICTSFLGWILK